MVEGIDPAELINEVKKWPQLYDKDHPDKTNLEHRRQLFTEISINLVPNWEELKPEDKELKVEEITKKWRNLRDTFRKYVDFEKKRSAGKNTKPRSQYKYFKQMMFLLPHFADEALLSRFDYYLDKPTTTGKRKIEVNRKCGKKRRSKESNVVLVESSPPPPKIVAAPSACKDDREEIDEDKTFLMSLVPSFKRMSEEEKLTAKVEILQALRQVKQRSQLETVSAVADSAAPFHFKQETHQHSDDSDSQDTSD